MISRSLTICNSVGLHARPATFFVQKANSFKSSIWVEKEDCRVNAKSLLGVLSLGITKASKNSPAHSAVRSELPAQQLTQAGSTMITRSVRPVSLSVRNSTSPAVSPVPSSTLPV